MKKRARKVLMICILAFAMFLTTATSSFGSYASADFIPKPQNTGYGSMYIPPFYRLNTDYTINGVHHGKGDYDIPSNTVLARRLNSTGDYVEGCQLALRKIHTFHPEFNCWPGEADGAFGYETEAAVMHFQTTVGITCDGEVGNNTLYHLQENSNNQ